MLVRVRDEPKAKTRRKTFNYVLEGNVFRPIKEYAVDEQKERTEVVYSVPMERIQGKYIYEFTFTNSGGFIIFKYLSTELLKNSDWNRQPVDVSELNEIQFQINGDTTRAYVSDINNIYTPMIAEVNGFKARIGMDYILTSERLTDYLKNVKYGLASSLCYPDESAREKSLEVISKLIHQLWVLKVIHESLGAVRIERGWSTEQGKNYPASVFENAEGMCYSCWFEPQIVRPMPSDYEGRVTSFFEEAKVAWLRPDLVVVKGKYDNLKDVSEVDVLIECKNLPLDYWWDEGMVIEEQLVPYKMLFNPKSEVLVSLQSLPNYVRQRLEQHGFEVVYNVYPNGKGVQEFAVILRRCLLR